MTSESTARVRTRVTPFVTTVDGGVRSGVLATLVDVVGGAIAARVLLPDWMATADLTMQLIGPVHGPWVEARGALVRRGRTTLVIEAQVVCVDDDGGASTVDGRPAGPVAWASMTFSVMSSRNPSSPGTVGRRPARRDGRSPGAGSTGPSSTPWRIEVLDAAAGRLSVPVLPYLHNSFGAMQGGVIALVAEAAGAEALAAARGLDGDAFVVTDLQIAYLALGRIGPVVTSARVLGTGPDGRAGAVVELRDSGAERPPDDRGQRLRRTGSGAGRSDTVTTDDRHGRRIGDRPPPTRQRLLPTRAVGAPRPTASTAPVVVRRPGPDRRPPARCRRGTAHRRSADQPRHARRVHQWPGRPAPVDRDHLADGHGVRARPCRARSASGPTCCGAAGPRWSPPSTWSTKGRVIGMWPPPP